jgi:hypothetical protein
MFGARGLADAQQRALEYAQQLSEISSARLRARFLREVVDQDLAAKRLMKC